MPDTTSSALPLPELSSHFGSDDAPTIQQQDDDRLAQASLFLLCNIILLMKIVALLIGAILLAACGVASTPTQTIADPTTRPSPTTPATGGSAATRTPEPGFTLIPSTPILPTDTPAPCVNNAAFLADLTVPDNTEVVPGAPIDKRWEVQNIGTCDWNSNYRVAFFEGNQMSAAGEHALYPARAGNNAIVQVNMIAPDVPGDYTGRWQLRDPEGRPFGAVLFIKIVVIPLLSPTPTP